MRIAALVIAAALIFILWMTYVRNTTQVLRQARGDDTIQVEQSAPIRHARESVRKLNETAERTKQILDDSGGR